MKKRASKSVTALCLGLLMLTQQGCSKSKRAKMVVMDEPTPVYYIDLNRVSDKETIFEIETPIIDSEECRSDLGDHFETQGALLNQAIIAILQGEIPPVIESIKSELFENTNEIASRFAIYYDESVAKRIKYFLDRQVQFQLAYIHAVKFQNPALANQIRNQAFANAELFVEYFNIMNPYFSKAELPLLDEIIVIHTDQTKAYLRGDWCRAEDLKFRSLEYFKDLGIELARAIAKQSNNCDEECPKTHDCEECQNNSSAETQDCEQSYIRDAS